jgi:hypothetical protein
MGTHSADHFRSKRAFTKGTFAKLSQVIPHGAQFHVEDLIVMLEENPMPNYVQAKALCLFKG